MLLGLFVLLLLGRLVPLFAVILILNVGLLENRSRFLLLNRFRLLFLWCFPCGGFLGSRLLLGFLRRRLDIVVGCW